MTEFTKSFSVGDGGYACQMIKDGKEISSRLVALEVRDNGDKLVLLGDNDEAIAKLIYDGTAWFSVGRPLKLYSPNGASAILAQYRPQPVATP